MDADAFNKWAAENVKAPTEAAPAPTPDPAAAPAADPAAAAPAAVAADPAPATPAAPAATTLDGGTPASEPKPADPAAPAAPATEPARDAQGRFVSVSVHAREVTARDTRISELEAELATAKATAQATPTPKNLAAFNELREKLKDEAPEFVHDILNAVEGQLIQRDEKIAAQDKELATYRGREEQAQRQEADQIEQRRVAAMKAVPGLYEWEQAARADEATADDKERWASAIAHDKLLRGSRAWDGKPDSERFGEAMKRAAADLGIEAPKAAAPADPTPAADPAKPNPKPLPASPAMPADLSHVPSSRPAAPVAGDFAGANLSFAGALEASRTLSVAAQQKLILGVR